MLIEHIQRRKAARKDVRLGSTHGFDSRSRLRLESFSRLGNVLVDQTQSMIPLLSVGAYSYIRSGSRLLSVAEIGRYCSIGRNVTLGLNPRNHPLDWVSSSTQFSGHYQRKITPLVIGHDVWIGDNAVIMAGINVGHGAVIGCNAVVTKNVMPYQIVAGNPARPIRLRFSDSLVEEILSTQWWRYDKKELDRLDFENVSAFASSAAALEYHAEYGFVELHGRHIIKSS